MEKEQLIELYNPANSKNLTPEQVAAIQHLSNEELKILADAYPNQPSNNNYLILKDTKLPDNKQTYQQSTFSNLYNLRSRHNKKNFVAVSFRNIFTYPGVKNLNAKIKSDKPQDLSKQEAQKAEGIKQPVKNPIPVQQTQTAGGENVNNNAGDNFEDLSNAAAEHANNTGASQQADNQTGSTENAEATNANLKAAEIENQNQSTGTPPVQTDATKTTRNKPK